MAQVVMYRTFSEVIEIPDEILEKARIPGDMDHLGDQIIIEWLNQTNNWPNPLDMMEDEVTFNPLHE